MAEDVITRREHEEFARRIDTENERQNKRISLLEESLQRTNALTVAVEKMAVNMEIMLRARKARDFWKKHTWITENLDYFINSNTSFGVQSRIEHNVSTVLTVTLLFCLMEFSVCASK